MKTKLFFILLLGQIYFSYGQAIQIDQITPTAVSGGINVNLVVTTFNGAGYLSHTHTINGNTINISVCYWFNITLPVFQITNDFFIPVPNNTNYVINVSIFHSSVSATLCDFHSAGPTATVNYLDTNEFEKLKNGYLLFPNPTNSSVSFVGDENLINNLSIYDCYGKQLQHNKTNKSKSIDLSHLKEGIYIITIETNEGILNQKVVVKK